METKKWTDEKRFDSEMMFFGLDWEEITFYGHPAGKNLFKVNNRSTRTRCGITSYSSVSILDFQQVNGSWAKTF